MEISFKYHTKLVLMLLILSGWQLSNNVQAQITATQMGMLDFKIDQNLTSNEMNGTTDVTVKLQAAVNKARNAYKSLFIPTGTYLVSNTISCILDDMASPNKPANIIGSSKQHPVIKLADNTAAFSGATPKAVFTYRSNTVGHGTDWVMEGGIRAIDFDLGTGNSQAVALYWGCAQYSYIEDIYINARNGFAGLTGIGGANNLLSNITVDGGQHGLYLPTYTEGVAWEMQGSPQNTITGCTFTNQTDVPIVLRGWGGITMIGITIVKAVGIAMRMDCDTYASVVEFPFSLIDSKIEFTNPQASNIAIQNQLHGNVSLRGVFVKGAGKVCNNGDDEDVTSELPITNWTCVKRFDYIDKNPRSDESGNWYTGTHYNALAGTRSTAAIIEKAAAEPSSELTSQHIWASTPSFEDVDAFLVPANSSAATIQNAINTHQKVCLAKGTYSLSNPIKLKSNTILFGCPGIGVCGSILKYGWVPTSQSWLIETENDALATTYLMDISTDPGNANYLGSLCWQAGCNSIIRTVHFDLSWDNYEMDLVRLYFSDNGGGRVFNYQDEKNLLGSSTSNSLNHRKVKISGTSQALTFYGLNLERGGSKTLMSSFPMLEMVNSSNIRILGAKSEALQPYALINNCINIFMTNIIDYVPTGKNVIKQNYIEITGNSDSIEISNVIFLSPPDSSYKLVADPWNTNEPNREMHLGLYHRNWSSFYWGSALGIREEPSFINWSIFPNPSGSVIYITSTSEQQTIAKGYVYNIAGTLCRTFMVNSSEPAKTDLSGFAAGIYEIVLQPSTGQKVCFKVIKN